jgi:hypothetical protein
MEYDERLSPAAGPYLSIADADLTREDPSIGRLAHELALIDGWTRPRHDSRAPQRTATGVMPAIYGRAWQGMARKRHGVESETAMSRSHAPTVPPRIGKYGGDEPGTHEIGPNG